MATEGAACRRPTCRCLSSQGRGQAGEAPVTSSRFCIGFGRSLSGEKIGNYWSSAAFQGFIQKIKQKMSDR
ncbi:hypothetical protein VPH35_104366 [Triticum aestivum]|uniref:Uncharacterized protein n=1 Tax=Triticum urartu TaxID=4572 RepID=A0A8R7QPN1_TRIUA